MLASRPAERISISEWLGVGLAAGIALAAMYLWGTERSGLFKDDTDYYGRLAENLADPARLPYTFRVLSPWIVSRLPLDTATAFSALTLGALWLTTLLLNSFLAGFGIVARARWAALIVFLCSGVVVRMLTTPTYVDPLTYLLTMVSLLALLHRSDALFLVAISIAVLNRETALLLLPAYLVARWPFDTPGARRALLICLVPVVVLGAVLVTKLAILGLLSDGLAGLVSLRYTGYIQRVPRLGDLMDLYSLFGVAWLALPFGWRAAPRWLQVYGALVVAQLLISRGDESRNLSHLFPLLVPLFGLLVMRLERVVRVARAPSMVTAAFLVFVCLSMVHFRWVLLSNDGVRYGLVGIGTLGGFAIAARVWRVQRQSQAPVAPA